MAGQVARKLRVDAQDNRNRILVAARELFADRGTDVGMRDVARRAGVGPATLYRRFPTRQALVDEVFAGELASCRTIVEQGSSDPDPRRGFRYVVTELILRNAGTRAFVDAFVSTPEASSQVAEHRRQLVDLLHQLARQVQSRGGLRADFSVDDLVLALIAARAVASADPVRRDAAARRFAVLILDALER